MKRFSILDIIISIITLTVVCVTIVPAVALIQRSPEDAKCQSNMARYAEALRLYLEDNQGSYPTNRRSSTGSLSASVQLSPRQTDENGNPIRFVNGVNWVEALYPYLIKSAKTTGRDWETILKCPSASDTTYPATSQTARVTYVFNYNLLEQPFVIVKDGAKLMILREFDRLMESCCRPANDSTASSAIPPQSPFLTRTDFQVKTANSMLHGQGSYILFADGHVRYFGSEYFPATSPAAYYDTSTQRWWNYINNSDPTLNKAIAVTP